MASVSGISKFSNHVIRNRLTLMHKLGNTKRIAYITKRKKIMKTPGQYSTLLTQKMELVQSSDPQRRNYNLKAAPSLTVDISNKTLEEELKNNITNANGNILTSLLNKLFISKTQTKAKPISTQIEAVVSDYNKVKPMCPSKSPSRNAPYPCPPCPLKCPPYPQISKACPSKQDPCKTKKDPCQPSRNPCQPKQDPCKPKNDPCQPRNDPCQPRNDPCKPRNDPCRPRKDPCKPKSNPCQPRKHPCGPKEDPCKPKKDPCQPKPDPCKRNANPCQPKPNPCQPKKSPCSIRTSLCVPSFTKYDTIPLSMWVSQRSSNRALNSKKRLLRRRTRN